MAFKFFLLFISSIFLYAAPQKKADNPKDEAIKITIHDGRSYCYSPNITKGNGYVLIADCNYATPARYDVFHRISWKINGNWLCMTAPSTITGIEGKATENWDWVFIKACAINDPNQRWIIKEDGFYTLDGRFRVKDYKWYAILSKNSKDYYDHKIDTKKMQNWINTIATPGTISFKTFIGWTFIDTYGWAVYYLQNNASYADDIAELYYNPENGHIAQYYYQSGDLYCINSKQSERDDWNWVSWIRCTDDEVKKDKDSKAWSFFALNDNAGALKDRYGNVLRITKYGTNWGVPYTAKPSYLAKDTANSANSIFLFSYDIDKWNRYVNANLADELVFCPSPGKKFEKSRVARSLPPDFVLTDEWLRRLWQIATTADSTGGGFVGVCGTCVLHTYQMIAELQTYHVAGPPTNRGYFFDIQSGVDPMHSFESRYPHLATRLRELETWSDAILRNGEDLYTNERRLHHAMAATMFPNYELRSSNVFYNELGARAAMREMLSAPIGSIWIMNVVRTNAQGTGTIGHTQPVLRVPQGIIIIPTNAYNFSLQDYRSTMPLVTNEMEAMNIITLRRTRAVLNVFSVQVLGMIGDPLNFFVSNNNCTGEGDYRHGSGGFPTSASINQCASGRCGM